MPKLTPEQLQAKATILAALEAPFGVALLTGYAGVGKSTLVAHLCQSITKSGLEITVACPTHKAAAVVRDFLREDSGVQVDTIHKIFGMRVISTPDGKTRSTPPTKRSRGVLIVDEVSMLNEDMQRIIMGASERVLFVGDPAQLPPVEGEELSPVFSSVVERAHLSKVIRQAADNPIIELATWLRRKIEAIEGLTITELLRRVAEVDPMENKIGSHSLADMPMIVASAMAEGMDARMLGYTNAATAAAAHKIKRELAGGGPLWPYNQHDPIYFNSPKIGEDGKVSVDNNVEATVIESWEPEIDARTGLSCQRVRLSGCRVSGVFKVSCDVSQYRRMIKKLQDEWTAIDLKRKFGADVGIVGELRRANEAMSKYLAVEFCDIRINHAMTIHKSQGSTFDCVVLDLRDIFRMKEHLLRALYVAITRPSKYLVLCS